MIKNQSDQEKMIIRGSLFDNKNHKESLEISPTGYGYVSVSSESNYTSRDEL